MMRDHRRGIASGGLFVLALLGSAGTSIAAARATEAPVAVERVAINDNRKAVGTASDGVLTVRLEARVGEWRPDGDTNLGVRVKAFAVEGQSLQVPGPLLRVTEGTAVHAFITNRTGEGLAVRGLYARPGSEADAAAVLVVPPGETRDVRFVAGAPGAYYYWGSVRPDGPIGARVRQDSQLTGAFVVDARGGPAAADRVLVVTLLPRNPPVDGQRAPEGSRFVINGRSWPHTERLAYRVGDDVRMQVINAGAAVHPMHLHGFYFNVDGRGNGRAFTSLPPGAPARLVVTERLPSGGTFALTWKPTRPGNWLFHCHDNAHLEFGGALDGSPAPTGSAHRHVENHALEMMAGPVMGITVTGASTEAGEPGTTRRELRLVTRADEGGTDKEPAFTYVLEKGAHPAVPRGSTAIGPPIILKRGEPVRIAVVNELGEPTSVHWHGIELESYYDGVPGYAGLGKKIAPAIRPGTSFDALFTPPRSGTFMYHTHIDETRQQQAGLTGPLLVVDDPATYDPVHDFPILITVPRNEADRQAVLLNGSKTPAVREMKVGERYRLRWINLHTFRPTLRIKVMEGDKVLTWRALAKDGMDLPADRAMVGPAEIVMGNGESYDFEFSPSTSGDLRFEVLSGANNLFVGAMPITVR